MAYDSSTGIITAPVSIYDVQCALGESNIDLGRLCQSSKLNKWSKMKPVTFPYLEPDRTQRVSAYNKQLWWWQGKPGYTTIAAGYQIGNYTTTAKGAWITCCGVKYIGLTSASDVLGAFDPLHNPYRTGSSSPLANNFVSVYPQGSIDEPFRLTDFRYYDASANYNVIPDYGTESGTTRIDVNNPQSDKVTCGIMSQAVSDTINSELSFNDLFTGVGTAANFRVICGILNGSTFDYVSLSYTINRNDDLFKEIALNLNDSRVYGKTVLAIYCAAITIGSDTYYVPLMQSTGDHPNTTISYAPRRKIYNSWYIDNSTPYYAITFTQKQNFGSGFAWSSVTSMTSFMTNGAMNRWYLKIAMPKKTSAYSFGNNSFKIELTGQFLDSRGQMQMVYYALTSADTRFVLKNQEVTDQADWGTTETVIVPSGTGPQDCYLAIYDLFANRSGVDVAYGGTVWRVRLFFRNGSEFSPIPDVEYGSIDSSHLNIAVPAVSNN